MDLQCYWGCHRLSLKFSILSQAQCVNSSFWEAGPWQLLAVQLGLVLLRSLGWCTAMDVGFMAVIESGFVDVYGP